MVNIRQMHTNFHYIVCTQISITLFENNFISNINVHLFSNLWMFSNDQFACYSCVLKQYNFTLKTIVYVKALQKPSMFP